MLIKDIVSQIYNHYKSTIMVIQIIVKMYF